MLAVLVVLCIAAFVGWMASDRRDPRVNPKPGDRLMVHGGLVKVVGRIGEDPAMVVYEWAGAKGCTSIESFREWVEYADLVMGGGE